MPSWKPTTGAAPGWLAPILVLALLSTIGLVGLVIMRPVDMTVREFLDAERDHQFGGFRIQGEVVKLGGSVIMVQDASGKSLSDFTLRDETGKSTVHYDADDLSVRLGQVVKVSGAFQKTLVFTTPGKMQRMTLGYASEVEVLSEPAPVSNEDEAWEEDEQQDTWSEQEEPGRWDEEEETESWEDWDGDWQWDEE